MPRTILWLGAVLGVGWFCSDAFAFGLLARLRNGQGTVVSADTPAPPGTTIENGRITNGDAQGAVTTGDANGAIPGACSRGHGVRDGALGAIRGNQGSRLGRLDAGGRHVAH